MPRPMLFGYQWYSTGHIHQFSIRDFEQVIEEMGKVKVERIFYADQPGRLLNKLAHWLPNIFSTVVIFLLERCDVK